MYDDEQVENTCIVSREGRKVYRIERKERKGKEKKRKLQQACRTEKENTKR
jgi:hypothetical protein